MLSLSETFLYKKTQNGLLPDHILQQAPTTIIAPFADVNILVDSRLFSTSGGKAPCPSFKVKETQKTQYSVADTTALKGHQATGR